MTRSLSKAAQLTTFSLVVGLGGCGGSLEPVAPSVPNSISASSATFVTAVAGETAFELPAVIVKDQRGAPMAGVLVTFAVIAGGGTVSGGSVSTSASGSATVGGWTLGGIAGVNALSASVSGISPVTFLATGTAGRAAMLQGEGELDGQTAAAGTAVAFAPLVTVKDANGNPVSGFNVVFAVTGGGGSVTGGAQTTNIAGTASPRAWTLGNAAGRNSLTVTAGDLPTLTFTATGT